MLYVYIQYVNPYIQCVYENTHTHVCIFTHTWLCVNIQYTYLYVYILCIYCILLQISLFIHHYMLQILCKNVP